MLKLLHHHLIHSKATVAWSTSALVHAVVVGVMAGGGAAAMVSYWDSSTPPGNAITLSARFASQSSASDELHDFTISHHDTQRPPKKEQVEPSPQLTEIERTPASAEQPRPVIDQGELEELPDSTQIADTVPERKPSPSDEPQVADADNTVSPRRSARRVAEPSVSDRDILADDANVQPSIAGSDDPPRPLATNASPGYPPEAFRNRREGQVVVLMRVSPEGRVVHAQILKSSGWPDIDAAGLATAKTWKFIPARRHGVPVAHEFVKPWKFRIEN